MQAEHKLLGRILVGNRKEAPSLFLLKVLCLSAFYRALQESYLTSTGNSQCSSPSEPSSFEKDLQLAMELSVREQEERERQRREEEDAELQQVLQLSLVEK